MIHFLHIPCYTHDLIFISDMEVIITNRFSSSKFSTTQFLLLIRLSRTTLDIPMAILKFYLLSSLTSHLSKFFFIFTGAVILLVLEHPSLPKTIHTYSFEQTAHHFQKYAVFFRSAKALERSSFCSRDI